MQHDNFRAGAFSGLLAAALMVVLAVWALTSMQPQREAPMRTISIDIPAPELPLPAMPPQTASPIF